LLLSSQNAKSRSDINNSSRSPPAPIEDTGDDLGDDDDDDEDWLEEEEFAKNAN